MKEEKVRTLEGKRLLLIVSGSIAAEKALALADLIKKKGAFVRVVLTHNAQQFVTGEAFEKRGFPVFEALFSDKETEKFSHIDLTKEADLVLVAPATANLMAKMAMGLADDLACALLLACRCPIMVFPAMNHYMWQNPATESNTEILRSRGILVFDPLEGELACGDMGVGRFMEPPQIVTRVETFFHAPLKGRRILITAGGTQEPLDPVRYLSNSSSGKQAVAIARACFYAGAEVFFVHGAMCSLPPAGVHCFSIQTADQMLDRVLQQLETSSIDVFFGVAAVADYKPKTMASHKIKKGSSPENWQIELVPNVDILSHVSHLQKNRPLLSIGFTLETENLLKNALEKLKKKGCDWILANSLKNDDGDSVLGGEKTHLYLLTKEMKESSQARDFGFLKKEVVADSLVKLLGKTLSTL